MIKLKDLLKILPNPCPFSVCIIGEHGNTKAPCDSNVFARCTNFINTFSFRDKEDSHYTQDNILEFMEYEVCCIAHTVHDYSLSNGGKHVYGDYEREETGFFIYIDKPIVRSKRT